MFISEISKQIFRDLCQHKLRSALAVFGIVWGTVAVVLLLALGQGFYTVNKRKMDAFAQGVLFVYPGQTSLAYQGLPRGSSLHLKAGEIMALPKAIPALRYITPMLIKQSTLVYNKQQANSTIKGISADYNQFAGIGSSLEGRFINLLDVQQNSRVIFLTAPLKTKLFGNKSAIGKTVMLQGASFRVIGTLQARAAQANRYATVNTGFIPYSSWIQIWGDQDVNYFLLAGKNEQQTNRLQRSLLQYLAYQHRFDPADEQALYFWNITEQAGFINWFFRAIQLFLGFCGAMVLAVGGIGLANTMYLIIIQRTAEIGLRMALGARDWQILLQFFFEASFLVLLGSIIGALLSAMVLITLNYISLPAWLGRPEISPLVVALTIIILAMVGLTAGYFPARRAAQLTPIEALNF